MSNEANETPMVALCHRLKSENDILRKMLIDALLAGAAKAPPMAEPLPVTDQRAPRKRRGTWKPRPGSLVAKVYETLQTGPATSTEIAAALNEKKNQVSASLTQLFRKRLADREPHDLGGFRYTARTQ